MNHSGNTRQRALAVQENFRHSISSFQSLFGSVLGEVTNVDQSAHPTDENSKLLEFFVEKRHDLFLSKVTTTPQDKLNVMARNDNTQSPAADKMNSEKDWRIIERMKTVSVALVVCLNIGIDPPDLIKPSPCARLQCWIDPSCSSSQKVMDMIGKALQAQYEFWQPRARYKQLLDPTGDELKKLCSALRRSAKDERVLIHYNGHGVPKPTSNGELWVFNKNFTQYIPVSIYDLQTWTGSPAIYVFDCSSAAHLINSYLKFAEQRDKEEVANQPKSKQKYSDVIMFGSCGPEEVLIFNPDYPADLFTSCLTTPIETALRWFVLQNRFCSIDVELAKKLPGKLNDRRTPLGELNWIFTAVTDTIAWNTLELPLFKKLFRQDLMVAALYRNFLLAERIFYHQKRKPYSFPKIPPTHCHGLWASWDLAVDVCLNQLPGLLKNENPTSYISTSFFSEQLTAFEISLDVLNVNKTPEQLPIVLQVLLSQSHRLRALVLLGKFLDLGSWAVHQALAVGIFPYILKLLQSPAQDLKLILVFIWARIIAVDTSCKQDLLKDNGYQYFTDILFSSQQLNNAVQDVSNLSELRAMAAFILSVFCNNYPAGQHACVRNNLISACFSHLSDFDPLLRQWSCILLGKIIENNREVKMGFMKDIHNLDKLNQLLVDPSPEVRAAVIYCVGLIFGDLERTNEIKQMEENLGISIITCMNDGSPLVRKTLVLALARLIDLELNGLVGSCNTYLEQEFSKKIILHSNNLFYDCILRVIMNLSMDLCYEISSLSRSILQFIFSLSNSSARLPLINNFRQNIKSFDNYFEWSSEFFKEPRLKPVESSSNLARFEWNNIRNSSIIEESQLYIKERSAWSFNIKSTLELASDYQESIIFHSYEKQVVIVDDRSYISVYDYKDNLKVSSYQGNLTSGSRITDLKLINEANSVIMAAGSDDGVIRLYKYFNERDKVPLQISSWRALWELIPDSSGIGIVMDWYQQQGFMAVSGDVKVIKIWDAEKELCSQEFSCKTHTGLTCLTGDKTTGVLLVGGCADGSARVYDRRQSARDCCIVELKHPSFVVGAHLQSNGNKELITASSYGDVKIWDLRFPRTPLKQLETDQLKRVNTFDVHDHAPIFGVGSYNHFLKLYDINNFEVLVNLRPQEGFLGQRYTPVNSIAFHPNNLALALGGEDGIVSIYGQV